MEKSSSPLWRVLGLDIGGTQIKVALVSAQGEIIKSRRSPTPASLAEFSTVLRRAIEHLWPGDGAIRAVGVGCKGIIDPETTAVVALPGDLNYLEGHRLDEIIAPLLPAACPIAADNDARVALEGEWRWGTARGRKNVLMMTLGTGVGGAILADGRILRGAGGVAGHVGHLTVDPNGKDCICGNRGCLETAFSARAIESEAFAAVHGGVATQLLDVGSSPPSCSDVFECARRGDGVAKHILERASTVLAGAIAGLIHVLDPEIVILGGQIAESSDLLLDVLQHEVDWRTRILLRRPVPIVKSQMADHSGVLGAAALAIEAAALNSERAVSP